MWLGLYPRREGYILTELKPRLDTTSKPEVTAQGSQFTPPFYWKHQCRPERDQFTDTTRSQPSYSLSLPAVYPLTPRYRFALLTLHPALPPCHCKKIRDHTTFQRSSSSTLQPSLLTRGCRSKPTYVVLVGQRNILLDIVLSGTSHQV